ncbi:hypothetical protein ACTU6U_07755 [Microbacterium sp. A196]|uniref:hypothetical protein n=1 Tax=Microbacterium sp. A196 TaxID=3457320 RepID=UPI003FD30DF6
MRRKGIIPLLALSALVSAGFVAVSSAPALADAPPAAVEEFTADLCAGSTPADPTAETVGGNPLNRVFGERLTAYNAGHVVTLYGTSGKNEPSTPNCGVRFVEGVGPVSEWMYCTDMTNHTCSVTDEQGELTHDGGYVGTPELVDGNGDLTAEQQRVIEYIAANDLTTTPMPEGYSGAGETLASNDSEKNRSVRQQMIWCVSDADLMQWYPGMDLWCPDNIGDDVRARILASAPVEPVLELAPVTSEAAADEVAPLTLTTNLLNQPIALTAATGTIELCAPQDGVELENGAIIVTGSAPVTTTVDLCTTGAAGTDVSIQATAEALGAATWAQSPFAAPDGTFCQVYTTASESSTPFTASASIAFAAPVDENENTPTNPSENTPTGPVENAPTNPSENTPTNPVENGTTAGDESAAHGELAVTGADSALPLTAGGALLLAAGIALAFLARRRQGA